MTTTSARSAAAPTLYAHTRHRPEPCTGTAHRNPSAGHTLATRPRKDRQA
jgi:hypothetical protein